MVSGKTGNIRQTVFLPGTPDEVYEALMDEKKHAAFSGSPAKISRKVGGSFTAYGDYIKGKNLEILPGKKIVQEWRASDWKEGAYSVVSFAFFPAEGGTKVVFSHTKVPAEEVKDISSGWKEFYWAPMKNFLKE